ncbi:MAG: ORF6C domain-containing protein [Peptostreptococcaceae bacterium]
MQELAILDKREVLGMKITVYGDVENPKFLAKDVANWIEHSNHRAMVNTVDEDEKEVSIAYTPGGNQEQWFLTEDGLYEVLMQSRKPIAKEFKKRVKKLLKDLRLNNDPLAKLSTEMKAILMLDEKQQETNKKVDYLYDFMTIDYEQQGSLFQLARDKAVFILGGKDAPVYKKASRKVFQELWRDYKKFFKVNSYKNTATKDYEDAITYLMNWQPSYNLKMEIESINNQMMFN